LLDESTYIYTLEYSYC